MPGKKIIIEDDVTFLEDTTAKFVSLVERGAIQEGFKIIKGDKDMKKVIHSVLVPKDLGEDRVKELSKEHSFSIEEKQEDVLDGFDVFKQCSDEEVDLESKNVGVISKDEGVYSVIADPQDKRKGKDIKEMDYVTMDSVADSLFAMADIVMGTLRQPEATDASRRKTVMQAIDNFRKHAEAVLSNSKSEDIVAEDYEVKGENLESLFYHVEDSTKSEEEIDEKVSKAVEEMKEALKSELEVQAVEKSQEKFDEVSQKFEDMKKELNDSLNEQFEAVPTKEEVTKEIDALKDSVESLKTETKSRKSEVEDTEPATKKKTNRSENKKHFITFAQ